MPCIYLRVSRYVAAFMRSVGDGQSLPLTTPIEFSPYRDEYTILTKGLRVVPETQQHRASCYSQSAWNNMLRGKLPQGGKPIINRNPNDYLTYAEICTLERLTNKTKTEAYEFICIAAPKEIVVNGRVQRVSKSHTLDSRAAQQMRRLLREDFIRNFLKFMKNNKTFADGNNFERSNTEVLERFFMENNVPVSHDQKERSTLLRLIQRWKKEAEALTHDPTIIGDPLVTRIDEYELRGGLPRYDKDD